MGLPPKCRCGWDGEEEHPCHYDGYRCRKPAKHRFYYDGHPFALAGAQFKLPVYDTWACDEHWEQWLKEQKPIVAMTAEEEK